jgi:hypothetical protein
MQEKLQALQILFKESISKVQNFDDLEVLSADFIGKK